MTTPQTRKFPTAALAVAHAVNAHPDASFETREDRKGILIRKPGTNVSCARITLWDAEAGVWQYRREVS